MIGSGGLAAEAPGGEAEGGVWKCHPGGEEEAVRDVRRLRTCSSEKPALEAAARTGERSDPDNECRRLHAELKPGVGTRNRLLCHHSF